MEDSKKFIQMTNRLTIIQNCLKIELLEFKIIFILMIKDILSLNRPLLHARVGSEYEEGGLLVGVLWRWTRRYSTLSAQAFSGISVASYPSVQTYAIPLAWRIYTRMP